MLDRCSNPNYAEHRYYFDRGISICEDWKNDFLAFKEWSERNGYADNLTIDRIDNAKGYSPDNCRWTTTKQQSRNRRNNILITYDGETKTLVEWCEQLNLPYGTIEMRINRGWNGVEAITKPIIKKGGKR